MINFTQDMIQIIVDTYPKYGIIETVARLGLTENEKIFVQRKAQNLKLKRIGKYFTQEEIDYLKANYSTLSVKEICNYLGRSKEAIVSKASQLGLSNDVFFYSKSDIQFLKNNYKVLTKQQIADKLGKSYSAIDTKLNKLGLTEDDSWSEDEIKILKQVYPYYSNKKIEKDFLPKRKSYSIATMAHKFDLVKNNEKNNKFYDKDDIIKQLKEATKILGRPPYTTELKQYNLPSAKTLNRYFNQKYQDICSSIGLTPNYKIFGQSIHCIADDGTACASKSEQVITNYLISHNIKYKKEEYYKDYINDDRCQNKRFDWVVGDYFIEFFGMPEKRSYQKRIKDKTSICEDNNIKLIALYKNDLNKLDEKLHMLLQ